MNAHASRVDRFVALCAGAAAVTAVAISLYQASLAREQLRAAAWPYVTQANSLTRGSPYRRVISNDGVGPARIRQVIVLVDGKPLHTWNEVVKKLTGSSASSESNIVYSSFHRGGLLRSGERREILAIPPGELAARFWLEAQTRLNIVVCYCSIYQDCWKADATHDEPYEVAACGNEPGSEFRQ